jgi:signal transduction histidine kinase
VALVAIAALSVRDWFVTRAGSHLYLVLAIGSLAGVSVLGQAGRILGPSFTAASGPLTIVLFLGSGLALMLFRDSVLPLRRRSKELLIVAVAITAAAEIALQLLGTRSAPPVLRMGALLAFMAVWIGCVGEPSTRLWFAARGRGAVQHARMRALSYAYLAIVVILLVAVFTASLAAHPAVQIGFGLAGLGIVPLLYAGFTPPTWLRRIWRQSEEARLQSAIHDLLLFAPDQATMAKRGLDWTVRLTGADAGFFVTSQDVVLALNGLSKEVATGLSRQIGPSNGRTVVPLGGTPPANALLVPLPNEDGRIVLIGGPFTPVFGTDDQAWIGQYAALISTGLDRVHLVEQVTARTRELESANRELEAFSYTISHDLRAPLRAINGFTSILMEEYADGLPEEGRGYLRRVRDNGEHMGRLVDDLLAFSRLGRQALRTQAVDTRAMVDRALAQLAPMLEGRNVDLVVGELPQCQADPHLLEQVFVNLLSNAIKYTQKKASARIEIGATQRVPAATSPEGQGGGPTFFVRDNGAGFDMAYANKLFGVFQRLHRSTDYEGTGVGLAIVHRIIDRHGGRIWAEAAVDQGATFYFTLKGVQQWQQAKAA